MKDGAAGVRGICVVCQGDLGAEILYPNAWERVRKLLGCCSEACLANFEADTHWMPSVEPELAPGMDQAGQVATARRRLEKGDDPVPIVRDMLLSGVLPLSIERVLVFAQVYTPPTPKGAFVQAVLALVALARGRRRALVNAAIDEDPRFCTPKRLALAHADLGRWRARFGSG